MPAQHVVDGATEQVGDVGADLAHLEVGLAHHREHAARLNAARDVDRLARAVVEVDRRADRDEVVGLRRFCGADGEIELSTGITPSAASLCRKTPSKSPPILRRGYRCLTAVCAR